MTGIVIMIYTSTEVLHTHRFSKFAILWIFYPGV